MAAAVVLCGGLTDGSLSEVKVHDIATIFYATSTRKPRDRGPFETGSSRSRHVDF